MIQIRIPIIFLFALLVCTLAWAGGRGGGGGQGGYGGQGFGGGQGGHGGQSQMAGGYQGQNQGYGDPMARNGRQSFGGESGMKKYRSNLYNDDDVYGYDATYPNGEALYINYKTKDARARRGQEFARTSRAYSRQGGNGGNGNYERSYGGGNGMSQMGQNGNY